jgi:hypothetical protein
MSKKPFDHIENKIREAAENSEPAFDEQAWDKMEAKLNKENDKKRGIFLWLPLSVLLIAGLGGFVFIHQSKKENTIKNASTIVSATLNEASATSTNNVTVDESLVTTNKQTTDSNKRDELNNSLNTAKNINKSGTPYLSANKVTDKNLSVTTRQIHYPNNGIKDISISAISHTGSTLATTDDNKTATITANKKSAKRNKKISRDNFTTAQNEKVYASSSQTKRKINGKTKAIVKAGAQTDQDETDLNVADSSVIATVDAVVADLNKEKKKDSVKTLLKDTVVIKAITKDTTTKKESVSKKKNWYLLASVGPDISNVALLSFNNSTVTARYGVGIGYQINKRISVQTGFYAGRKKYVAGPSDYHSKDASYLNNVDITKVDANCLIFEIPITFRYNFILRPKTIYYATAGLSSFIMKNEAYNYDYTYNSISYQSAHSYTGNQNLFSIASLSVGIERKISKAFSIQIEPSINIPIAGVGEGQVKLYSTDLQVGVKYNFHW